LLGLVWLVPAAGFLWLDEFKKRAADHRQVSL
jgi:hypothetical protein